MDEFDKIHPQKVFQVVLPIKLPIKRQGEGDGDCTFALKTATMSSGYGIRGGIGRCYPFFADLKECLVSTQIAFELFDFQNGEGLIDYTYI